MSSYSYRIERHPGRLGGGWRLQLLENGVEVEGRVYRAKPGDRKATQLAYVEALGYARQWLVRQGRAT